MASQLSRQPGFSQPSGLPNIKQDAWHNTSENVNGSYLKRLMILRGNLEQQKIDDVKRFATNEYNAKDHLTLDLNCNIKDMRGPLDVTKYRGCLAGAEPVGRTNHNRRSHLDRLQQIREKQKQEKTPPHLLPLRGVRLIGNERTGARLVASQPAPKIERETAGSLIPDFSMILRKKIRPKRARVEPTRDDVLYHIHWMQGGSVITPLPKNRGHFSHPVNQRKLNVHNLASSCPLPRPLSSRNPSIFRRSKLRDLGRQSLQQVALLRTDDIVIGEKPSTVTQEQKHRELPRISTIISSDADLMRKQIIVKLPLLET